jgi:hypothetical protein
MRLLQVVGSQIMARTSRRSSSGSRWAGMGLCVLLACGCQARIGDGCSTNQQCSGQTQRLCDITQPGGYCTILNCSPTSCPEGEGMCVTFGNALSPLPGCQNASKPSPYARSLCMQYCSEDTECRPGYVCRDISGDDPWSADIATKDAPSTKICIAIPIGQDLPEDRATAVCVDGSGEGGAGGESGR